MHIRTLAPARSPSSAHPLARTPRSPRPELMAAPVCPPRLAEGTAPRLPRPALPCPRPRELIHGASSLRRRRYLGSTGSVHALPPQPGKLPYSPLPGIFTDPGKLQGCSTAKPAKSVAVPQPLGAQNCSAHSPRARRAALGGDAHPPSPRNWHFSFGRRPITTGAHPAARRCEAKARP